MLIDLFLSSFTIAGIAVIWRNWLHDHPAWKEYIQKYLKGFYKVLLCGSCFTYWISLLFLLIHNPLQSWILEEPIIFKMAASWMALAFLSVSLRFLYVLIQENVHRLVHAHDHKNH